MDQQEQNDEMITIGDILDTLNDAQQEELKKLVKCVVQGKSTEKIMHHLNRFGVNELQMKAIEITLKEVELRRKEIVQSNRGA